MSEILIHHRKIVLKSVLAAEKRPVPADKLKELSRLSETAFDEAQKALLSDGLLAYLPGLGGRYKVPKDAEGHKELAEAQRANLEDLHREIVLACVPEDGSPKGNITLQQESGLAKEDCDAARKSLIADGFLTAGRGRGGSVYRSGKDEGQGPQGRLPDDVPIGDGETDEPEEYIPTARVAKGLAEISRDFTSPRELAREMIANSIDAEASKIWFEAFEDDSEGERELVIRITDNGSGMTKAELKGFFDLGTSTKRRKAHTIGEKGHGAKIAYNSSKITVASRSADFPRKTWRAKMDTPKKALNLAVQRDTAPPAVLIEPVDSLSSELLSATESGTVIEIRGYDSNNFDAFMHGPLKDYGQWFTAWGRIDAAWGARPDPECTLNLKGIHQSDFEEIPYGHPFPDESYDFRILRGRDDRRPENLFVKRWVSDSGSSLLYVANLDIELTGYEVNDGD
jgi:hypothetical protein